MACTNYVEIQAFFTTKNFTPQDLIITLQGSAYEMLVYFYIPCNYTIDDISVKSIVIKNIRQ
jgi:hypothetical protein